MFVWGRECNSFKPGLVMFIWGRECNSFKPGLVVFMWGRRSNSFKPVLEVFMWGRGSSSFKPGLVVFMQDYSEPGYPTLTILEISCSWQMTLSKVAANGSVGSSAALFSEGFVMVYTVYCCFVSYSWVAQYSVVVSVLYCQSRGWGSNPHQGRNLVRNFCSI